MALAAADIVVVLELYPARERAEDHPGVSGIAIAEAAADAAGGRPVYWLPAFADAGRCSTSCSPDGDVCVVMGAGDVDSLARSLARAMSAPAPESVRAGLSARAPLDGAHRRGGRAVRPRRQRGGAARAARLRRRPPASA